MEGSLGNRHRRGAGAHWCIMVYSSLVATAEKVVRQSVSLPGGVARRVKAIARTRKASANRVLVELIERGLEAQEDEKHRFFDLAERLTTSRDPWEQQRLKAELARMTFGE